MLSEEERQKGFVRPVRRSYTHVGDRPKYPLFDLTSEQIAKFGDRYIKWEQYPDGSWIVGRYWTQKQLDKKACFASTRMGLELCETYARDPHFYGATFCVGCSMHLPISEFVWDEDGAVVGS